MQRLVAAALIAPGRDSKRGWVGAFDNDNKAPRFNAMHPCPVVDVESIGGDAEGLRQRRGHRARFLMLGIVGCTVEMGPSSKIESILVRDPTRLIVPLNSHVPSGTYLRRQSSKSRIGGDAREGR